MARNVFAVIVGLGLMVVAPWTVLMIPAMLKASRKNNGARRAPQHTRPRRRRISSE